MMLEDACDPTGGKHRSNCVAVSEINDQSRPVIFQRQRCAKERCRTGVHEQRPESCRFEQVMHCQHPGHIPGRLSVGEILQPAPGSDGLSQTLKAV